MNDTEFQCILNDNMSVLRINALKFASNENDADDLVQETLIKAFRFRDKFQPGTNFKGWLFFIMRNTFINSYRKLIKSRKHISFEEDLTQKESCLSGVENVCTGKFIVGDIQKTINALPEVYRYPFIRYFEGYSYNEIADDLDIPLGTVKTRIHIARQILKKHLKPYLKQNS